jgi:endonuclease YncB( thermonuclease family)
MIRLPNRPSCRAPRPWRRLALAVLLPAVAVSVDGSAAEPLPGPIPAEVVRVIDGDSLAVRAAIWIGQTVETVVRLKGVDAPEVRGACSAEKALAAQATATVAALLRPGDRVLLHEVTTGKFAGRVVARVATEDGRDLATALLVAGLAEPYDGGRRDTWC